MTIGAEFGSTDQEFRVIASKGDLIYRWLNLIHDASKLPTQGDDSELMLGAFTMNNSLLAGITSRILSSGNNYELGTIFLFRRQDETEQQSSPSSGLIVPGRSSVKDTGSPMSIFDLFGGRRQPLPIILSELHNALEKQLNPDVYILNFDSDEDIITIHVQNDPAFDDVTFSIGLHLMPMVSSVVCKLEMRSRFDRTALDFEKKYQTFGFVTQQLAEAIYKAKNEPPPSKTVTLEPPDDIEEKMEKTESVLRFNKKQLNAFGFHDDDMDQEIDDRIVFEGRPSETFDEIGGQPKAKEALQTLAYSLRDPEIFRRWGTTPPRRILLYGPTGTGKTLLARALANSAEAGIFVVEIADIVHSLYGRSERFIQRVFERARQQAPVILFFDEMDALATHRQYADNVTSRIVNVLLTNLDGMRETEDNIMVVGSTNRLEAIDRALLRAGRFDVLVEVPLPNDEGREEIFRIHIERAMRRAGTDRNLFSGDFDLKSLVRATPGFSGADIMEVLRRALNKKVRLELEGQIAGLLTTDEVIDEIKNYESIRVAKERKLGFDTSQ